jgi:alcohol dehydrogenase
MVRTRQIDARKFITHHFEMDQFDHAYEVFGNAAETRCAQGRAER